MQIDDHVLLVLKQCDAPIRIADIHRLIDQTDEGATWREVAAAVTRLVRIGLLDIQDEVQVGQAMHPAYGLTAHGIAAAGHVRYSQRQQAATGTKKVAHDSARECAS